MKENSTKKVSAMKKNSSRKMKRKMKKSKNIFELIEQTKKELYQELENLDENFQINKKDLIHLTKNMNTSSFIQKTCDSVFTEKTEKPFQQKMKINIK